jgi:HK97 family phage portal protein
MSINQAWSDNPELWFQMDFAGADNRGAKSSPVEAAVSLIASDIATIRPTLLETDPSTGVQTTVTNSPITRVLNKPNSFSTRVDFFTSMIRDTLYRGNAYAWIERDRRGQPVALYHIQKRQIIPKILPDGSVYYSVGLTELERGENLRSMDIPAADIIHHRVLTMAHPLIGVSPLYAIASSAALNAYLSSSLAKFHENSARPGGILTIPGGLKPEARERLRHEFSRTFTGENSGKTAILDVDASYLKMGSTASENQAVDLLKYSVEDVARALRVPRFMLGLETVGQASVEQSSRMYYSHCLRVHIEALENRLDDAFGLNGTNRHVEFDVNQLFRAESTARMEALGKGVQNGIYTPNEARKLEHLPPIEGGDDAFLQQQMVGISLLQQLHASQIAAKAEANSQQDSAEDSEDVPPMSEDEVKALIMSYQTRSVESEADDVTRRINEVLKNA